LNSLPVEHEAARLDVLALALTEGVHELGELCATLDLEEDLIVGVGDLDVEMLLLALLLVLRRSMRRTGLAHVSVFRCRSAGLKWSIQARVDVEAGCGLLLTERRG